MNPWEGIASQASSMPQGAIVSPWEGIASPVAPVKATDEKNGLYDADSSKRTFVDKINRQMQLVGRAGFEGITSPLNIPSLVANGMLSSADYLSGGDVPTRVPYPATGIENGLDAIGMPKPEDKLENIEGGVLRGVSGAKSMGANPMGQTSGAVGGGISETAKQLGYSPTTQFAAGLIGGGIGGPALYNVGQGMYNIVAPFTQSGRNSIANNIIASHADDPQAAATALQNVPRYVSGSNPTGGTASGDLGLIGTEKTLMQNPANYFGDRLSEQNTARTNLINQVAGDEMTIPNYTQMRSNATSPLYAKAMGRLLDPQSIKPVLTSIDNKLEEVGSSSDAGKMLLNVKNKITDALPNMQPVNSGLFDAQGLPISRPQFQNVTGSPLTQIYKETRDVLQAKGMQVGALGSTIRGVIKPINQQLGEALEIQNPDLQQANDMFARMSVPINQAENMQTLVPKMTGGIEDLQGQNIFSPSKVGNIMKSGEMATEYNGVQPLKEALSPEQYQALQTLNQDLQRSNAVNIPMVRPPGSNTFNNQASTGELANSLAGKAMQYVPIVRNAYGAQNTKIMQAIAEKMLEPELTRQALLNGKVVPDATMLARIMSGGITGVSGSGAGIMTSLPYYGDRQ